VAQPAQGPSTSSSHTEITFPPATSGTPIFPPVGAPTPTQTQAQITPAPVSPSAP